jgi:hypothetical protein
MHTFGMCHVRADAHGDDRLSQKPSGFQSHAPANERMGRDARNATPRIDVETEASCLESHGRQEEADVWSRALKLSSCTRLAQMFAERVCSCVAIANIPLIPRQRAHGKQQTQHISVFDRVSVLNPHSTE